MATIHTTFAGHQHIHPQLHRPQSVVFHASTHNDPTHIKESPKACRVQTQNTPVCQVEQNGSQRIMLEADSCCSLCSRLSDVPGGLTKLRKANTALLYMQAGKQEATDGLPLPAASFTLKTPTSL